MSAWIGFLDSHPIKNFVNSANSVNPSKIPFLSSSILFRPLPPSARNFPLHLILTFTLYLLTFTFSPACGLDWTLPQAHFAGVDESGCVAYWEKIGQADLGDGLLIPVHIGFNSHREASSPTLGKGWILPLLESHVEPVDENTMHVIMPDGWTFLFLRNGNTETWRGNAGWIGQTDDTRFTITAPCGWRIKYDTGKIQEIDTPANRAITIRYNGHDAVEADLDNKAFVQVEQNTATGVPADLLINGQKIDLALGQRPRITTKLGQNLVTGFDPALSQLQYPDGTKKPTPTPPPKTSHPPSPSPSPTNPRAPSPGIPPPVKSKPTASGPINSLPATSSR